MQPEDLPGTDPNTLPYFITEAQTGHRVPARFEPLTSQDTAELNNEDWTQAAFAPTWLQLVHSEHVYKLMRVAEQDRRIQGLIHVGMISPGITYLANSLLEAAPFNQRHKNLREYIGVGRVLVARLAAESFTQGRQGRVLVHPRSGTEGFYTSLGFYALLPRKRNYVLDEEPAATLLRSVCLKPG